MNKEKHYISFGPEMTKLSHAKIVRMAKQMAKRREEIEAAFQKEMMEFSKLDDVATRTVTLAFGTPAERMWHEYFLVHQAREQGALIEKP